MKRFRCTAFMVTMLAFHVDGLFAANVENNEWTQENSDAMRAFCWSQCGNSLFQRLVMAETGKGNISQYFDASLFVKSANEDNGHKFLSCILEKASDEDKIAFAQYAAESITAFDFRGMRILHTMVEKHPITRAHLRTSTVQNIVKIQEYSEGQDFLMAFALSDKDFCADVSTMRFENLNSALQINKNEAIFKLFENIVDQHPELSTNFVEMFKSDEANRFIGHYTGKKLFLKMLKSGDSSAAIHVTGFENAVVTGLLSSDLGKDLVRNALEIALKQPKYFSTFKRPDMLLDVISHKDGGRVVEKVLENKDTSASFFEFAQEYFHVLSTSSNGLSVLKSFLENGSSYVTELSTRVIEIVPEIAKIKSGRAFLISLVRDEESAIMLSRKVDVAAILQQRDSWGITSDNGLDVLKAICNSSKVAAKAFQETFSNRFSENYKQVEKLQDGKSFLDHLSNF